MPFNPDVDQAQAWEANSSTRTSLQPYTKYVPVDTTLAVAGTAEDLYNITNLDLPAINFAPNPGFETGSPPTGYTLVGSTLASDAGTVRTGAASLSITGAGLVLPEGAYMTTEEFAGPSAPPSRRHVIASAYFRDAAGGGDAVRIAIRDTSGTLLAAGNEITLSATFQRSVASYATNQTGAAYRIYFETSTAAHATEFFVDDFMLEHKMASSPAAYVDGSLGVNYDWQGTANASQSRRRKGVQVVRGWDLHFTLDTYVAFDQTASSTTGVFCPAGTDWSTEFQMGFTKNISIINKNAGETPQVYGVLWGLPDSSNPEAG